MYLSLATLILTAFLALHCVDGQARTCYFGPPPQPDPDNPDRKHWMKLVTKEIRKKCPHTTDEVNTHPKDCSDVLASGMTTTGVYTVQPRGDVGPFEVYCDMEQDGGGWTMFQRRKDGSVDFYRDWESYRQGFGDLDGEFWLGNDNLHQLTAQGDYELMIDLGDFKNNFEFAVYDTFRVADGSDNYRLTVAGYSGTSGDSLLSHNNKPFSTKDRDNDDSNSNCAQESHGAWWYWDCADSNLNGDYIQGPTGRIYEGVVWNHWTGPSYSLQISEMRIKIKNEGK